VPPGEAFKSSKEKQDGSDFMSQYRRFRWLFNNSSPWQGMPNLEVDGTFMFVYMTMRFNFYPFIGWDP
jgi:hypothetical protein